MKTGRMTTEEIRTALDGALGNVEYQLNILDYLHERLMDGLGKKANPNIVRVELAAALKRFWPNWKSA